MRKKLSVGKRMLAFVLAFAMAFTAISWGDVGEVKAEEGVTWVDTEYFTNGSMDKWIRNDEYNQGIYEEEWTKQGCAASGWIDEEHKGVLKVWAENGEEFSFERELTIAESGTYRISFEQMATVVSRASIEINVTCGNTTLVDSMDMPVVTGEAWSTVQTAVFDIAEENSIIKIKISGTNVQAGYWSDYDNFVVQKKTDAVEPDSPIELENLNWTFENNYADWRLASDLSSNSTEKLNLDLASGSGRNGGNAVSINNDTSGNADAYFTTSIDSLPVGTYKFTAYVMGTGFQNACPVIGGSGIWDAQYKVTSPGWQTDSEKWAKIEYKFTVDSVQTNYKVGLYMWTYQQGWSYVDDVSLVRVYDVAVSASKKSYIAKNEVVTLTANMESAIELGDNYKLKWTVNNTLGGLKDATFVNPDAVNSGTQKEVQVQLPTEGVYYISATLKDASGKELANYTIKLSTEAIENVYVEKLEVPDGFIKGVDISSLEAELASGVKFHDFNGKELDEQGFFNFLKECGINWVRIRVWNNPYDEEKNGYGGGNCDLEKAKSMGKYATDAGLRVLIDFHYSDTWADPKRQLVPKAWQDLSVDDRISKIGTYTQESVAALLDAGVDVGMVQIGNETSNTICGIKQDEKGTDGNAAYMQKMCEAFNAGAKGVRDAALAEGKSIKVAIHIESPQEEGKYAKYAKALNDNQVDYDVFASSYYPMWHGSLDNLNKVLSDIANTYGKEVLVAETSWAYTYEDGDGHGNEDSADKDYDQYEHSVQGQVNQLCDVTKTIANTPKGIGVFYWEPAWIPVNYIYDDASQYRESAKEANKVAWETYGSGWATNACAKYDPVSVGTWAGGSAVDNHAWFDWYGYPLASMKAFKYMETGNDTLVKKVWKVEASDVTVNVGEAVIVPSATVRYNYGADETISDVNWDQTAIANACASGVGTYEITGSVEIEAKTYPVTFSLNIIKYNYLEDKNYSFEDDGNWVLDNCNMEGSDPHSGAKALKYGVNLTNANASQTITLNKGIYTLGAYMQGRSKAEGESYQIFVTVGNETKTADAVPNGWYGDAESGWQNPEIENIKITSDNTPVTLGCKFTTADGAWGTWDDFYLNKTGDVSGGSDNGNGGSSSNPPASSGSSSTPSTPTDNKTDTADNTTTTKNPDGTTTETKTETATNESGKEVETTVTTNKDADGKVTGSTEVSTIAGAAKDTTVTVTVEKDAKGNVAEATAEVTKKGTETKTGTKGTISAAVVAQIKEAAGSKDVAITTSVTGADGKEKYSVTVDASDLVAGAKLTVVVKDAKTGKAVLVDAKQVKVSSKGNVSVVLPEGNDYTLIDTKEAAKVTKEILKTVVPAKTSATLKAGKSNTAKLSTKLDMDNVKKITYTTSKKSVVTVNKNGKVVAKKAGTATITIKVTLNNGKTKTVKMKYKVK